MNVRKYDLWGSVFLAINIFLFERIVLTTQNFLGWVRVNSDFMGKPVFYGLLIIVMFISLAFFSSFSTIVTLLDGNQSSKELAKLSVSQVHKIMMMFGLLFLVHVLIGV